MNEPPDKVYASVGKAVMAAQYFEQWLVAAYYHMRIATEPGFALSDAQLSDYRLFKNPTKNLLNALSERSRISPELEGRINALLEQRHIIVHRWYLLHGSPSAHSTTKWLELEELSNHTCREANQLSYSLVNALRNWLAASLAGAPQAELEHQMLHLFQQRGSCA